MAPRPTGATPLEWSEVSITWTEMSNHVGHALIDSNVCLRAEARVSGRPAFSRGGSQEAPPAGAVAGARVKAAGNRLQKQAPACVDGRGYSVRKLEKLHDERQ
jgi:hypothetical protein